MANPFKEAEKKHKVAPGGNKTHDVEKTEEVINKIVEAAPPATPEVTEVPAETVAPVAAAPVAEKTKTEKKQTTKAVNKIDALLGPAEKPKKHERSTMAVYLSKENQAWLKDLAHQRGKSVSELLDQILNELRG